uniref:Uncharacterized protein n=1 Tax=Romanomermis culicivorax TaxID=13658 RepID=A0A915IP90_ROMCU
MAALQGDKKLLLRDDQWTLAANLIQIRSHLRKKDCAPSETREKIISWLIDTLDWSVGCVPNY